MTVILDDEAVASMVRGSYLPALLVALAHATGDWSLLPDELRPDPSLVHQPQAGLTLEQRAAARDLAAHGLRCLLEAGDDVTPSTDRADLRRLMEFLVGAPVSDDDFELLLEELGATGEDMRAPGWHKDDIDPARTLRVAIVGAGMSGLVAAHRLRQAGIECVVLEKNAEVGGTWLENHYPGCRVDVPNHLYSYSFLQRDDWPQRFSPRDELLGYFARFADDAGLRDAIRFGTEVVSATFRDDQNDWELHVRRGGGAEELLRVDALVSAVGQLNRPSVPDIEGRDTFAGPWFHSARWDQGVDITGKRVAVV